jgi:hypothetical protein
MEGLLASLEAFLDEGKKHSILFIRAVKEGTDMAVFTERCASEPYRLARFSAEPLSCLIAVVRRVYSSYYSSPSCSEPSLQWM